LTDKKTQKLVLAALFSALCAVMTLVIQIPSPMQGYVHLGDCAVLLSAWIVGPLYGGAAAGIGSMLADLLSGYAHYAPGTLIIKFAMGFLAALIFHGLYKKTPFWSKVISGAASGVILVAGYFAFACLWLGKGWAAAASIPGNIVQAAFGLIAAMALYAALQRSHALAHLPV
jgi:ECF transporter S component (folate family)